VNNTQVLFISYNYIIKFTKSNFIENVVFSSNAKLEHFYQKDTNSLYKLPTFKGVFSEGVKINFINPNPYFYVLNQLHLKIKFIFFGLFWESFLQNFKNLKVSLSFKNLNKINSFFLVFPQYESFFVSIFRVKTSIKTHLQFNPFFKIKELIVKLTHFNSFLKLILMLFLVSYAAIVFFYKCGAVIPNFLNINLINLTIILFAISNSNSILEKNFIDLMVFINKVNYNNLENIYGRLNFQEKYFLKYESTYFTDKKCSES